MCIRFVFNIVFLSINADELGSHMDMCESNGKSDDFCGLAAAPTFVRVE